MHRADRVGRPEEAPLTLVARRSRRLARPGLLVVLRRHPRARWVLATGAAVAAGILAARVVGEAEAARSRWDDTVAVVVATRDVDAGEPLRTGDLARRDLPAAVVPDGAVREVPDHATARVDLHDGEVVLAARLAPGGVGGVAAQLGTGERAVAVPVEPAVTPPLAAGDRVDVVVAVAPAAAGGEPPGFVVVAGARVVHTAEAAVTLAVPAGDAPRVAVALAQGAVTLALTGP